MGGVGRQRPEQNPRPGGLIAWWRSWRRDEDTPVLYRWRALLKGERFRSARLSHLSDKWIGEQTRRDSDGT